MTQRKANRTKRKPIGVRRLKMNLDSATEERLSSEGKVARWFNDVDTRIDDAVEGGYEFVMSSRTSVMVGDDKSEQPKEQPVKKFVGKNSDGSPQYAYLMAIKEEWYKEDQQAKEEVNKQVDRAVRGGNPKGLADHGVDPARGTTELKGVEYQP